MVSIFVGSGAGFARGSGATLGGSGVLGSGVQGRSGESVSVNAATGNLLISQQDDFLVGRGPDAAISRTYNSLAEMSDGDNGDHWQFSSTRRVFGLTGMLNAVGSTIRRQAGDGSVVTYSWDAGQSAYVATDGDGAHDQLVKSGATWVWTDGSSRVTETYEASVGDASVFRLKQLADTDGNMLGYLYALGTDKLEYVTTANHGRVDGAGHVEMSYVQYVWSGNNIGQIVTGYMDYGDPSTDADNVNRSLVRTHYAYDGQNRLTHVFVDLSLEDASMADGRYYSTTYTYDGSSKRVASITQTDGSSLAITYEGAGRVSTLTQTVAVGDARVTTLSYGANHTNIISPDGQMTRLDYAGGNIAPPSIMDWSSNPAYITKAAAGSIDGQPATLLTIPSGVSWSGTYAVNAGGAAGDTVVYAVSLQAVTGSASEQDVGLFGDLSAWGANGDSIGRIISGPGQFAQVAGGLWRVSGLSTTEPTRIEIRRYFSQTETGSANVYVDEPGGYRAGQQLLAGDAVITKNSLPDGSFRQLTKITAPPAYAGASAQTIEFGYDAAGNLVSVTDSAGKVTAYTYDANGNQLTATDANGHLVMRTYGSKNELLTETRIGSDAGGAAVSHMTRFVYDSENHLRFAISAEGRVTEYTYYPTGELSREIGYPEHGYPIGAVAPSEADMLTWRHAIADHQSVQIRWYSYDARGNVTDIRKFGQATPSGEVSWDDGFTHNYLTYDQAGRMIARSTSTYNAESFAYDGLGRLVWSNSLDGGMTTITFNDASLTTTVTTAAGYTTVNSYNKAGDLVATAHGGSYDPSGSTAYLYDKNGRVRHTTDATGVKRYQLYDKMGRTIADINSYGDIVEYRYDAAGRVAATIRYGNVLTAGQLAALDDPEGGLEMSAIRPAAAPGYDIWNWAVYDAAGRLVQSVAGDGSVSVFGYDASGRLISTVGYHNKLSAAELAGFKVALPMAPVVPTADARDMVSRNFYDRDGRLIGSLDGEGYLSETVYDKAGQKVEEIAYAARTSSIHWVSGSFDQLRASAAPSSTANRRVRYVYDGQHYLRFAIDAAGQVVEYTYNREVIWGATGLVRGTIRHAAAISTGDFTYDNVKALVDANISHAANRKSWSVYGIAKRLAYSIDADGAVTSYSYDIAGNVTKAVAFAAKRPTSSLPTQSDMDIWRDANLGNAANRVTRNWYTAAGDLRFTVDPEGYVRRFDYDPEGRVTAEVVWANQVTATDATTIAQIDYATGSAGTWVTSSRAYDGAGRLHFATDGEGVMTVYSYHSDGLISSRYLAYGTADHSQTHYVYDGAGRLIAEYAAYGEPEQAVTTYSYDGLGNRTSMTDPRGKVTSYTYDERGLVLTATDAAGGVTSYEYNAFGEVVKTTDARGAVTYTYYDDLGRVTMVHDAGTYVTDTTYTQFGEIATVTRRYNPVASTASTTTPPTVTAHAQDATTSFEYDKRGLVISTTDAEGFFESYAYDALGNRTSVTAKSKDGNKVAGGTTTYVYDKRGLLLSETLPIISYNADGTPQAGGALVTNSYAYDARGNRIQMVEAAGLSEARTTTYVYDKADRLTKTSGLGFGGVAKVESLTYDARGNVTSRTDPVGGRTVYYYDDLDRVVATIDAVGTYSKNVYDANGNILTTRVYGVAVGIPADGGSLAEGAVLEPSTSVYRETSFTYDNLNRLLTSSVAGVTTGYWNGSSWLSSAAAITTAYEYDAHGNVIKATDANGKASFSYYDKLGRKTHQVDAEGYLTAWAYDAEGNVLVETRYANPAAAPTTAAPPPVTADSARDRVTTFTYDRNGNRLSEAGTGILVHNGAGGVLPTPQTAVIRWRYNGLGQVVQKDEATDDPAKARGQVGDESLYYDYDSGGRLIREERAAFTSHQGAPVTPTVDYRYNGLGDLTRTIAAGAGDAADRITTYSYNNGTLWRVIDAGNFARTFQYDAADRVTYAYFTRLKADGTPAAAEEGTLTSYDAAGRVIQQWQATYATATGWTDSGPRTATTYNAYGEAISVAVGGVTQQQNQYDGGGRLIASNAGDGVWKHFGYDGNGNQTIAITSAGASLAGLTFAQALALVGQENVNATYTRYDARGQATSVTEEQRRLSGSDVQTLTSSRTYNAFGEVVSETDALGATTTRSYNNIGRIVRIEGPSAQITNENGGVQTVKAAQDFYYDLSGRLVATRDANGSYDGSGAKVANTGGLTQLTLLAGTGYGGSEALVTQQIAADGGIKQTKYDIHGDARVLIDEEDRTTTQSFDGMGRVKRVDHAGGLIDLYNYDGLGQRIKHWSENSAGTNVRGIGEVETTDYDTQGRVIRARAFGGDVTTTSYLWDGALATTGLGSFGGWVQTTSTDADRASASDSIYAAVQKTDIFGHVTTRTDKGGRAYSYAYDAAGRMISEEGPPKNLYSYYNSGKIAQVIAGDTPAANTDWSRKIARYEYDALGRLTRDALTFEQGDYVEGYWVPDEPNNPEPPTPPTGHTWVPAAYYVTTTQLQDGRADYDAAGRITRYRELPPYGRSDYVDKRWTYDASDNVRSIVTDYRAMLAVGVPGSAVTKQSYWYRYDSMNRVVTTKGELSGSAGSGSIVRGAVGTDLGYNAAGERTDAQTGGAAQEVYTYTAAGLVETVTIGGVTRAGTSYDLLGRVTEYSEYDASAQLVHHRHSILYDARGQVLAEKGRTKQGSNWIHTHSANYYSADGTGARPAAITGAGSMGTSSGTLLFFSETKNWTGGSAVQPAYLSSADTAFADAYQAQLYEWRDGAVQSWVQLENRDGTSTSAYSYDRDGALALVQIRGGTRQRDIAYTTALGGQILARRERDTNDAAPDPSSLTFLFGGRRQGMIGNDGTGNVAYAQSIGERTNVDGNGPFREGSATASLYADFDANFTALNGASAQGGAGGSSYTVGEGETLQGIAAALWGDANLWYKLAEANGMTGGGALTAGQSLTVPGGVMGTHHTAETFKPYDPAEAIGNTSPNTPKPPKQGNKCGVFGQILVAAIAIGVTVLTAGSSAPLTAQIGAAMLGSAVSQGFAVATGIQDKFSFKGVALAALSAGVTGGLSDIGAFDKLGIAAGSSVSAALNAAARGALSSAVTQGIATATGLQSKFDFAGVAAAGVGAGIGNFVDGKLGSKLGNFGRDLIANTAGGIANAATRSAIKGNSFGDNLRAAIPDIIGQTLGSAAARGAAALARAVSESANEKPTDHGGGGGRGSASGMGGVRDRMRAEIFGEGPFMDLIPANSLHQSASNWSPFWGSQGLLTKALSAMTAAVGGINDSIRDNVDDIVVKGSRNPASLALDMVGLMQRINQNAPKGGSALGRAFAGVAAAYTGRESGKANTLVRTAKSWSSAVWQGQNYSPTGFVLGVSEWVTGGEVNPLLPSAKRQFDNGLETGTSIVKLGADIGARPGHYTAAAGARSDAVVATISAAASGDPAAIFKISQFASAAETEIGIAIASGGTANVAARSARFEIAVEGVGGLGPTRYVTDGDLLQSIATRADNWGGRGLTGNGPVVGIYKHKYSELILDRYQRMFGDRGLLTEQRYVNGNPWQPGDPLLGSIKLDVIKGPANRPSFVWDYKFGRARLSQSRITTIQNGVPNGVNVSVFEIKP